MKNTFQRVGGATTEILIPMLVFTLGTKSKAELEDLSWIGFHTRVSNDVNEMVAYVKISLYDKG